jgi:hypothetical protein
LGKQGEILISFSSGRLIRFDPGGTQITYSAYLGGGPEPSVPSAGTNGPAAVRTDLYGNVYVAGSTARPDFPVTDGAFHSSLRSGGCLDSPMGPYFAAGDVFVVKLRAADLQPVFSTVLAGECWG